MRKEMKDKLKNLLERGCTDSDIEDFCEQNGVNTKTAFTYIAVLNAPDCCKTCQHVTLAPSFYPCTFCSRPRKDMYTPVSVISDVKDCLRDLPPVQKKDWIPVTEVLPESKTDVLMAFENNNVVGFWEDVLHDGVPVWYAYSGDGWFTETASVDNDGIPLAWQPLPENYKRKEGTEYEDTIID